MRRMEEDRKRTREEIRALEGLRSPDRTRTVMPMAGQQDYALARAAVERRQWGRKRQGEVQWIVW